MNARMERIQCRDGHVLLLPRTHGSKEKVPSVADLGRRVFDGYRFALVLGAVFVGIKTLIGDIKALGTEETVAAVLAVELLERAQISHFERQDRAVRVA